MNNYAVINAYNSGHFEIVKLLLQDFRVYITLCMIFFTSTSDSTLILYAKLEKIIIKKNMDKIGFGSMQIYKYKYKYLNHT